MCLNDTQMGETGAGMGWAYTLKECEWSCFVRYEVLVL